MSVLWLKFGFSRFAEKPTRASRAALPRHPKLETTFIVRWFLCGRNVLLLGILISL